MRHRSVRIGITTRTERTRRAIAYVGFHMHPDSNDRASGRCDRLMHREESDMPHDKVDWRQAPKSAVWWAMDEKRCRALVLRPRCGGVYELLVRRPAARAIVRLPRRLPRKPDSAVCRAVQTFKRGSERLADRCCATRGLRSSRVPVTPMSHGPITTGAVGEIRQSRKTMDVCVRPGSVIRRYRRSDVQMSATPSK